MPLHQCFGGPIGRENAIVAYKDFVLVYANLTRDSGRVIRMHQGIVNSLAHGILWNGVAFHPDQAVVTDACLEILEVNGIAFELVHRIGLHGVPPSGARASTPSHYNEQTKTINH